MKEFIAEFHRELNRLGTTRGVERQEAERQLTKVESEIRAIIDAIKSGIPSPTMAAELEILKQRKSTLQAGLEAEPPPPVRLHSNLAEIYRQKVENLREALENLREALNDEGSRAKACAVLRGLIDEVRLVPVDGRLGIYLVGNLAAILDLCAKKNPGASAAGVQVTLVAGAGFEPATFRL